MSTFERYTPTAEEVRERYVDATKGSLIRRAGSSVWVRASELASADFYRWLASVRADAWDEGERHESEFLDRTGQFCPYKNCNPYRSDKQ